MDLDNIKKYLEEIILCSGSEDILRLCRLISDDLGISLYNSQNPEKLMTDVEIWKSHPIYKKYKISTKGRVQNSSTKKILRQRVNDNGYLTADIHMGKRYKPQHKMMHRLIAETFIPNPKNKPIINHKDLDKQNNSLGNLEWATYKENYYHAVENGAMRHSKDPVLNSEKVTEIKGLLLKGLSTHKIGKQYGVSQTTIHHIKMGKTWKHVNLPPS